MKRQTPSAQTKSRTARELVAQVRDEMDGEHLVNGFASGRQIGSWVTRLEAALAAMERER